MARLTRLNRLFPLRLFALLAVLIPVKAQEEHVYLLGVPDYAWYAGCFGTASANLVGFWDRNGLPDMYTGPTGGGIAPLNSAGANVSIRALWASQKGLDGRPADMPGHMDDYWQFYIGGFSFESTAPDPYLALGRAEHTPDCLGDFIGQSQRKYTSLNGECDGNIDGFAFNFWDKTGTRRTNFTPPNGIRDIQSGLREWARYRGYDAVVSSQLADVNPETPSGTGFTFEDIKTEINSGYPVMLILQNHTNYSRALAGMPRANPNGHAVIVHGYITQPSETGGQVQAIRFKTSWGQGDEYAEWTSDIIVAALPLRGAITFRPQPKITSSEHIGNQIRLQWTGPNAILHDEISGVDNPVHQYIVERATVLSENAFTPVSGPNTGFEAILNRSNAPQEYFRVRLMQN